MSFSNGYRGTVGGSVQANYTDQPGVAIAGMLAYASDINLCDSMLVNETGGIAAGKGVYMSDATSVTGDLQRPNEVARLPVTGDTTLTSFLGFTVFEESMQSDENGVPGTADGRTVRVLRPNRVGGRIYVYAKAAVTKGGTIHLCTAASGSYVAGDLVPSDLTAGYSVDISSLCRWTQTTTAAGLVIVELRYAG